MQKPQFRPGHYHASNFCDTWGYCFFFWLGGGGYNFIQLGHYRSFLVFEKILIFILIKFYGSLCNLYLLVFFFYLIWFDKKKRTSPTAKPHPTLIPKIQIDNIFMQSSPRNMKSAHFCIIVILVPFKAINRWKLPLHARSNHWYNWEALNLVPFTVREGAIRRQQSITSFYCFKSKWSNCRHILSKCLVIRTNIYTYIL